jgi:hypothetical protein
MKRDYKAMLPNLIEYVELLTGKELTERDMQFFDDLLRVVHQDGYKNGSDMMYKIVMEARK